MYAQVNTSSEKYLELWIQIIKQKISNQSKALSIMGLDGAEEIAERRCIYMKEYYEKAIVGFNASNFLESQYCGNEYLTIISNGFFALFSREKISEKSQPYRNGFVTKLQIEELENVYSSKLFGLYNRHYYEIQLVSKNLESIELIARREFLKEDKQNGFIDDINERVTHKIVTLMDLQEIQSQKTSVYQELYEKYSQEKK